MSLAKAIGAKTQLDMYNNVDLWTNVDENTIALVQSGYATYFDFRGALSPGGESWVKLITPKLLRALKPIFDRPGFQIDISFTRDKARSREMLDDSLRSARTSAKNMEIDAEPLFEDMIKKLLHYVSYEGALVSFKTTINALDPAEKKRLLKKRKENASKLIKATTGGSPDIEIGETLRKFHDAAIHSFFKAMGQFFDLRRLKVADAALRLRKEACNELTPGVWRPILWGSKLTVRQPSNDDPNDMSMYCPPLLGAQIFPAAPELVESDTSMIKVGERYVSPMYFEFLPEHRSQFAELFALISSGVPFRYNVSVETGAKNRLGEVNRKRKFAQVCALTNSSNKEVVESADYLLKKLERKIPWVAVSTFMSTWGSTIDEVKENKIQLVQQCAAWGGAELRNCPENTFDCWMRSIPGISLADSSYSSIEPIDDMIRVLPIDRPSSTWDRGSLLLRSNDGKLLPMQPFSALQAAWNNLFFAVPGFGKSVFTLAKLLASVFAAGNTELPRQCLLDIGHSSEGYIDLLRAILPEDKKDQALLVTVTNDGDMRINGFDIPLGFDKPPNEESLAVDRLMEILVSPSVGEAEEVLVDAAMMLGKRMYEWTSKLKPAHYASYIDARIAKIVDDAGDELHEKPTWIEVRDYLFVNGHEELASIAHRQSVPNLIMAASVITEDEDLKSAFGNEKLSSGAPVLDTLKRLMSDAVSNYPIMAGASTFDFNKARIVAFNLRAVASDETAKMIKQSKLMYALARKAGATGYFATDVKQNNVPSIYYAYHKKIQEVNRSRPKEITYEEFHVPAAMEGADGARSPIVKQVEIEEKTGRKSTVGVNAVSQQFGDFSPKMIENANSIFVLYAGSEKVKNLLRNEYKVAEHVIERLEGHLTGPTSDGAPVFVMHEIKGKSGRVMQEGVLTLGSMWLWALCSTETDVLLRRELAAKVGFYKALEILVRFFPGGTVGEREHEVNDCLARLSGEQGKRAQNSWIYIMACMMQDQSPGDFFDTLRGRKPIDKAAIFNYLPKE